MGVFGLFCLINMILLFANLETLHRKRSELVYWIGVPLTMLLIFEMASIASFEILGGNTTSELEAIRILLQSFIIPFFLLHLYEIAYMMHTARGVDFCCISLETQKRERAMFRLQMMRYLIWLSIFCLILFSLTVNILAILESIDISNRITGNFPAESEEGINLTSNYFGQRFCKKSLLESFRQTGSCTLGCLADIIPWVLLLLLSIYFGILIWRFGYRFSSSRSPHLIYEWMLPLLASILLFISLLLPRGTEYTVDLSFVLLNMALTIVTRKQQNEAQELQAVENFINTFPYHGGNVLRNHPNNNRPVSIASDISSQISIIDQTQTSATSPLSFNHVTPIDGNVASIA